MVDKEKIVSKINVLKQSLDRLEHLRSLSQEAFLSSFLNFDAAKYNLIIAIEAMIDIGNHIISRKNLEIPETSSDTMKTMVKHGILPADKQSDFVAMVRFRNRAVHLYDQVNNEEIYRILQENLWDFKVFIRAIVKYLYG
ncbi:MAG TPA: DUF86 domain-containing protein [Bacillota bacterium]|nr:DUF86 domain-containing protein [Bacillota bacterium]HPT86760.1 DUF86 domain-containing protein [Bacillota bacterium]